MKLDPNWVISQLTIMKQITNGQSIKKIMSTNNRKEIGTDSTLMKLIVKKRMAATKNPTVKTIKAGTMMRNK